MSLMRSLTTRRKPEVEKLQPIQIGRAASQRGGRPVMRSQISPPLALVSTTNMLSFEAPDIAGTKPIQQISPASTTSSSSEDSDSSASVHSQDTDPTDLSSADASPVSPKEPKHLNQYFETATYQQAAQRSRASSRARSPPLPVLSLTVAEHRPIAEVLTALPEGLTPAALHPNTAVTAPSTTFCSPSVISPSMVFSPSMIPSPNSVASPAVVGLSSNGLTPVSAIRTPVSAIRSATSEESASSDSPVLPRRAPSHSKRAHEALSRKRSVQRARSPSAQSTAPAFVSRATTDITNAKSSAYADSPDSIWSAGLAQVQEEMGTIKAKYADAALDAHIIKTKGLAQFAAADYLTEIGGLVNVLLDDKAPTGPDFSGWF